MISTLSNTSIQDRLNYTSNRSIVMSLNIQIELYDGRFVLSCLDEVRKYADLSLVSSSYLNTFIDELFICIQYNCHEIEELLMIISFILCSSANSLLIFVDRLHQYHLQRTVSIQSVLFNPYRKGLLASCL